MFLTACTEVLCNTSQATLLSGMSCWAASGQSAQDTKGFSTQASCSHGALQLLSTSSPADQLQGQGEKTNVSVTDENWAATSETIRKMRSKLPQLGTLASEPPGESGV